jgi:N-acetylmuramoyl-L-alanine amidase
VLLTRDRDETLALEERTAFANRKKADLFISLHLNANRDTKARGIESYFLNLTTDETAIEVAARENSTSTRSLGELQGIINDLMLNSKINESSRFATELHKGLLGSSRAVNYKGADRGVRQAPFYVLLGAQMPSVLLELGFITNEKDAELLQDPGYQKTLVEGIWRGVNAYINNTGYAFYGGSDS